MQARERMEELTEHNRGIYYSDLLQAVPMDEAATAAKGIRRAEDKVSLPRSVGASLMDQDAPRNGAMMFELTTPGGSVTHAGLLEFTSPEGVVSLPRRVADCLWGPGAPVNGPVTVTYKRLEKGEFVRWVNGVARAQTPKAAWRPRASFLPSPAPSRPEPRPLGRPPVPSLGLIAASSL